MTDLSSKGSGAAGGSGSSMRIAGEIDVPEYGCKRQEWCQNSTLKNLANRSDTSGHFRT